MTSITVINTAALLPGDIILSTGENKTSWLIRAATLGSFSHAALHVGNGIAVEANDPGVIPVFLPAVSYETNVKLRVLRATGLSQKQRDELADFVWSLLFRPYSTKGAVGTILPFLRDQTDAGYFCSQLAAAAYESIGSPVSELPPWECKPSDLANSSVLADIGEAVQTVERATHSAVATLMGASYEEYLQKGNYYERIILGTCVQRLPSQFATPFNLYDLARQLFDGTVDKETSESWDIAVAGLIKKLVTDHPLAPCPGIGVATSLADADSWLVPVFSPEWNILMEDPSGKVYYEQFMTDLFTARNWEANRWLNDHERLMAEAKKLGSKTFEALAMWIALAATIRFQHAALLRNSRESGFLSPESKEKFSSNLKTMQDRHFSNTDS
ncbi:hypothetical protein N1937_20235 [Rhizobium sp. WSM4643]|uniref:hypothetical protein n=1 Tax=Rhizobium sp. WSM4643 TaxID=3138253 RepID=UPI0021A36425|nr:hypothetical protein [Rhizobium leguminosarum]UWM74991.1 hypothetical protein N1937_20235 [Rhizobium leguminosarum bv. viciae]